MPRKTASSLAPDPVLQLKILALRDDRLVHEYRDILYLCNIDSLQASGQRIASGERVVPPLSDARRDRLMKRLASLRKRICNTYKISGFGGGDPCFVKRVNWLPTLQVQHSGPLRIETNWRTSFSSWLPEVHVIPKNANVSFSESGTLWVLPDLPKRPQTSPCMTIHLDLSQVKRNALAPFTKEFKKAVEKCLEELPTSLRKKPSTWEQNVERDYRRFQQHFYQGIPYRWIAVYERSGAMPKRRVHGPVATESSVRTSVERVHFILFQKKLTTSRRSHKPIETTLLATTLKQFNCPDHGRDCPNSCQYGQDFVKNLQDIR